MTDALIRTPGEDTEVDTEEEGLWDKGRDGTKE